MADKPKLDCSSFEERIHQLLDDRLILTGDEMLMDHAAQCEPCQTLLNDYDSVDDSIKLLATEIELVIGKQAMGPTVSAQTTSRLGWAVSLAAVFLLMVGMFQSETSNPKPERVVAVHSNSNLGVASNFRTSSVKAHRSPQLKAKKRAPETSPFNPEFSLVSQIPKVPTVPTWEDLSERFNQIEPVLTYSSALPGVGTAAGSVSVTIDLIKQSFSDEVPKVRDFGWRFDRFNAMA